MRFRFKLIIVELDESQVVDRKRYRAAVMLFFFSHGIIFSSWASRIPIIKDQLGLSEGQLGSLLLMIPVGQLLTMPLVGKLVSKYGSHRILSIGLFFYSLMLIAIGLAPTFWTLAGVLMLFGTFSNMCNISTNTQGVLVENLYGRSIMTSFHGGWSIAGFFGALLGMLMIRLDITTWMHFAVSSTLVILMWLWASNNLIPDVKKQEEKKATGFKMDKTLIVLGVIGFCSMAVEGAMFDWSGVYFKEIVQVAKDNVVLGYTSFMIMMASGRFVGDRIIQKIGKKTTLQVSGILMFVGLGISVFFPQMVPCMLAFMLVGVGVACNVPVVYSIAGRHKTIESGIAITMVSSISFLGFLMGPPLIGYIAELWDLRYSFGIFALFGLLMTVLARRV